MMRVCMLWTAALVLAWAPAAQLTQEIDFTRDIVYGHADGVDLKLDMAKPAGVDAPLPVIVFIHGGGWQMGEKEGFEGAIRQFAASGYVAVSVAYRFAPEHPWPAQIEDVKCAVRYLRAHAEEHSINPDAIGVVGHSAGGHLALLLGLMNPEDGLEGNGGHEGHSSKVQAVINLCGPADLRTWRAHPEAEAAAKASGGKGFEDLLEDLMGTTDRSVPEMALASPVNYIGSDDPPVLSFHGSVDLVVPLEQSEQLHAALEAAGVTNELVVFEGGDHGFGNALHLLQVMQTGLEFADTWLKAPVEVAAEAE